MKSIKRIFVAIALALLGGCVAVPVDGYYGDTGYYAPAPGYYAAPYYTAPYYYGPSIGIGIYGGSRVWRDGGWRHHDRDHRWSGRRDGRHDGRR